jgi:hypothetical protein
MPLQGRLIQLLLLQAAAAAVLVCASPALSQQITTVQRNYTIAVDDEVVVRRLHPPPVLDDKGKPRKPTAEELKKMKGTDPKAKGYQAEKGDLKVGQEVVVTLGQVKEKAVGKSGDTDSTKSKKPYTILGEYTGKLVRPPAGKPKTKEGKEDPEAKESIVAGFESLRLPGQPAPAPRDKTRLPSTIIAVRIMIVSEAPER